MSDSVAKRLSQMMQKRAFFAKEKEKQIQSLKKMLEISGISAVEIYHINQKLAEEYRKYRVDTSVYYLLKNKKIAAQLADEKRIDETDIQLSKLYAVEGMYVESRKLLDSVEGRRRLHPDLLGEYYEANHAFFSHYGQSTSNLGYFRKSALYRDSLLMVIPAGSMKYKIETAFKNFYQSNDKLAEKQLLKLLENTTDKNEERAVIAYLLGEIYKQRKQFHQQQMYYSISAITDIKNAIKDNASLQSLALTYYESGDINKAYQFIDAAIDDAIFCNVRYRTEEGSSFFTIINAAYREKEQKQKKQLQIYLYLISFLSVVLFVLLFFLYKQIKRLTQVRQELHQTNIQLHTLNEKLHSANHNLQESNLIKEEYIAHFFNLCSAYIEKIENYRKLLYKKAANNQFQEVVRLLKSNTAIESELEELYKNFDTIFLKIYPTFVEEFNTLLQPEQHICPKKGELLNTELRIFALIRLGITDSTKIADFLRYSLRTVYNYRTKVRNKAAGNRDDFEELVKKINASYQ
ncbi:MAG: DUF6377 domain-containing protein [Capnocytophaga sp.]|nr:DUF6377 domain-containing protein [Capnocytophaga sp.]